jgi:hypothetical protein
MEINWSIAGWIIAILVFYTIGFFEGRGNGYKKRKREEELEAAKTPPVVVASDDPGILRLKKENDVFTLELDGIRLTQSSLTGENRKRLMEVLTILRPWLDNIPVAPSEPPLSQPVPASLNQPSTPLPPIAFKPIVVKPTEPAENKPAPPPTSIVGQINLILQEKLASSPLKQRGISLSQSPEGGVLVTVGASQFAGVDEVPDAEVKAMIRAAIAEWEKKYTPGLK